MTFSNKCRLTPGTYTVFARLHDESFVPYEMTLTEEKEFVFDYRGRGERWVYLEADAAPFRLSKIRKR